MREKIPHTSCTHILHTHSEEKLTRFFEFSEFLKNSKRNSKSKEEREREREISVKSTKSSIFVKFIKIIRFLKNTNTQTHHGSLEYDAMVRFRFRRRRVFINPKKHSHTNTVWIIPNG